MSKKTPITRNPNANIALGYIRKSWTRTQEDALSPERQTAYIEAECEKRGWKLELYRDTDGHKSGTRIDNRPGWAALMARLRSPDVVAVVAYDLSRIHRKGFRVSELVEFVNEHNIDFVIAAPGKAIDISTAMGKLMVAIQAQFDEFYATDTAMRYRDMIAYRKRQNKSMGLPPFGTKRNKEGYLAPSDEGAWISPDGCMQGGHKDECPCEGAIWRGYFDCARHVLELYSEDRLGHDKITYQLQEEGWYFRNRKGQPSTFETDDVRRIVANWAEYGGYVYKERARERHPHEYPVSSISLNEERSVFPVELLYRVGTVRERRALGRRIGVGESMKDYAYPLAGITYCAHCEALSQQVNDLGLRSRLGGKSGKTRRYRHRSGVNCGAHHRSVTSNVLEVEFAALLRDLTLDPKLSQMMIDLGVEVAIGTLGAKDNADLEARKLAAIAKCKARLDNLKTLFEEGELNRDEYFSKRDRVRTELQQWEQTNTEAAQIAVELMQCVEALNRIHVNWEVADNEEKQEMVRWLFESVIYNLDTQQITDFQLKPWAQRYLVLRSALYGLEKENEGNSWKQKPISEYFQEMGTLMTPTGHRGARQYMKDCWWLSGESSPQFTSVFA
jgi:DNA invertase Pin-like site-specific DNA recombinase